MQININKSIFRDHFLLPISKVVGDDDSNKGCIVEVHKDNINCLCNTKDGSVILNARLITKTGIEADDKINLNIFDLRKFIRLMDCIVEEDITLKINSNNLSYISPSVSFKYHLMDDGVVRKSVVNIDKINKLNFDTEFVISNQVLNDILRASSFAEDTNKIYLYSKNDKVYGDLTDKTKPNVDNIDMQISSAMLGNVISTPIPLSLDVLRKFVGIRFQTINVKLNTSTKILSFDLTSDNCILKYIATALVK